VLAVSRSSGARALGRSGQVLVAEYVRVQSGFCTGKRILVMRITS
jgi:hypothetical protein